MPPNAGAVEHSAAISILAAGLGHGRGDSLQSGFVVVPPGFTTAEFANRGEPMRGLGSTLPPDCRASSSALDSL